LFFCWKKQSVHARVTDNQTIRSTTISKEDGLVSSLKLLHGNYLYRVNYWVLSFLSTCIHALIPTTTTTTTTTTSVHHT
jgi:hypothetical protein